MVHSTRDMEGEIKQMKRTDNGYVLSTGKELDANFGIVGLSPDEDRLYEGYDGWLDEFVVDKLTREEKQEIADYMIDLWTQYKDRV